MNFLAHLYLSGSDPGVMVGNFIGDFVRGRDLIPPFGQAIAKGITLHRLIDEFTDHHPVVKESKNHLRPKYGHYSGVIIDIFYDHYLAAQWSAYSEESLADFAARAYQIILDQQSILPERVVQMMPYMMKGNWLVNYGNIEGIQRVLQGMSRRATFDSKMDEAVSELRVHYAEFESEFNVFFPELVSFSKIWLEGQNSDRK